MGAWICDKENVIIVDGVVVETAEPDVDTDGDFYSVVEKCD